MNHRVKRVFVLTRWLYHLENLKLILKVLNKLIIFFNAYIALYTFKYDQKRITVIKLYIMI